MRKAVRNEAAADVVRHGKQVSFESCQSCGLEEMGSLKLIGSGELVV
jgi:hypothetical protein